jgi:hypothetical protein
MMILSNRAAKLDDFGEVFEPQEAAEPILARPIRNALLEWLTEVWAEEELKAVGIGPRRKAIFDGPPGVGKAQPLAAAVLTTRGWSTIGELRIGDALASVDGESSQVTGIFHRGDLEIYRVKFSDGAEVRCSGDHLWHVTFKEWRKPRVLRTLAVAELIEKARGPEHRPWVPLFSGSFGSDALPLDPYLLGLMLGDGSFTDTSSSLHFTTADPTVLARFRAALPSSCEAKLVTRYDYRIINRQRNNEPSSLARVICELGLYGKLSYDKSIPPIYLNSSAESRRELLRGLLETDGGCKNLSRVQFYTSSEQLSKDVLALVRSLGGIAHRRAQYKNYTHKGLLKQGRQSWIVSLLHPFGRDLMTLPKHRERGGSTLSTGQSRRRIMSIEATGDVVPMACISVSHASGLYVTDDYVVTHNTTLGHHLAARLGLRMLAVRPERLISKYVGETGERIGQMFDLASDKDDPIVLFLDEFDAYSRQRRRSQQSADDSRNEEVNTLLQRLEQYTGFLIAATNFGAHIDQAIWRRFDIHITLALPGQAEREKILARYLAPYGLPKRALSELAISFETASPALIRHFCENLKRQLIVGPKLRLDMRREAVIGRLIATVKPHPDLGLPRLWSAGENDHAIKLLPWPLKLAADIVEDDPLADVENAEELGRKAARDGKAIIDNPFPFGDARRARFDEGWRKESETDGMGGAEVVDLGGRRK